MNEPLENIGFRCERHRQLPNPVYNGMSLDWFRGRFCKLAFPGATDPERKEYMWVKVTGLAETEGEELRGTLDNDPILATDFRCGDVIEFSRNEVLEVIEGDN